MTPAAAGRLLAAALLTILGGCASLSKQIARETAPIAAREVLEVASKPANARNVAQVLDDPAVVSAVEGLAEAGARGALRGAAAGDLSDLAGPIADALARRLADGIQKDVSPALQRALSRAIDAAIERSLSPRNRQRVRALAGTATDAATDALAADLRRKLIPALVRALSDALGRAAQDHADDIERTVGRLSYVAARQAVLGVNDGLRDLRRNGRDAIFEPVNQTLMWLHWLVGISTAVLLICVGAVAWLGWKHVRQR